MSDRTKVKVSFSEIIAQTLWLKGKITAQERDQMAQHTGRLLRKGNC